jgi:hypothetical protein
MGMRLAFQIFAFHFLMDQNATAFRSSIRPKDQVKEHVCQRRKQQ